MAHLAIERAMKTLIAEAGGTLVEIHNLKQLYLQLKQQDPEAAQFLEEAFHTAVRHYRYNPNTANMKHLKTLEQYLELAGSDQAFQDVRYWELNQSLDEVVLRRVYLTLHLDLLHALSELLLAPERPKDTVETRVDRAVRRAMWDTAAIGYAPGTPRESSVKAYISWRQSFTSWCAALADAVDKRFSFQDDYMAKVTQRAYQNLLQSSDPAVKYFASTLDVLPPQPRDVVPCVEWLGPTKFRNGSVTTPAGTPLGFIDRGLDGLWYISPYLTGRMSTKAKTQTDARSYLAAMQSRPVKVTVRGEARSLRIVGEEHNPYEQNFDKVRKRYEGTGDDTTWTHKVVFWDKDHGIKVDDIIELEVRPTDLENVVHKLAGRVTEVAEHEVYLSGDELFDLAERELN